MELDKIVLLTVLSVFTLDAAGQTVEEPLIVAERSHHTGGWFEVNTESEDVQQAAKEAVEEFNRISKSKKYFRLVSITSAHTQVTNRINYRIKAVMGKTSCLKSDEAQLEQEACVVGKKHLECEFDVALNMRDDDHEVQNVSCRRSS